MIELDLTPDVTIVQSIRAETKMNITEASAEFIDNSLDAGATAIDTKLIALRRRLAQRRSMTRSCCSCGSAEIKAI
jgi:hypothetical protein